MKRFYLVILCLLAFPVVASHIVGGELELIHVSGSIYRLNLIIYFDKLNGSPGAKDLAPEVTIYRKRDGAAMQSVLIPLTTESPVSYTQPECSDEGLKTDRLYYTTLITLGAEDYNDPQGYYISWQRCCRNYTIDNIYSSDPSVNSGEAAGQTFYLEFPPVVKNGQPFVNSSPRLFPPLSDYGCPNRQYYVDFAGIDDDKDSLVYSIVTPLNTIETIGAFPPARPAPYPEITWKPGFSLDHVMRGSPDLKISKDGLLTVTPTLQGLFVFAVKVDEFRNGEKIGETRRDFQMLVTDGCPRAEPPQIVGRKISDTTFPYDENMSVSFPASTPDNERKIVVRVSDPDASLADDNFTERVKIRVVALNFKDADIKEVLPTATTAILRNGSTADFTISFPKCPYFKGGPYQIGIIAQDDACSLPLLDTLKVAVNVEPPPNSRAKFVVPNPDVVQQQLNEGDKVTWPFEVTDAEGDALTFFALTNGFDLKGAGMETKILSNSKVDGQSLLKGTLTWDANCGNYNFTTRTSFEVRLIVDDLDQCDFNDPDTATFKLNVVLPGNADPIVDTDLTPNPQETVVKNLEKQINSDWSFKVTAKDVVDNDFLSLRLIGKDFKPSDYGMKFTKKTGTGALESQFEWPLRCDKLDITKKDFFHLQFLTVDSTNKCRVLKADTVNVLVTLLPDDNSKPVLSVASLNERVAFTNNELVAYLNEPINLEFTATDTDVFPAQDPLVVDLIGADGDYQPEGYSFAPVTGVSGVKTTFKWSPDCSLFRNDVYENNYSFSFRVADTHCGTSKADTVKLNITWKDYEGGVLLGEPPNIFTPNGDGQNDYFAMQRRDAEGNLFDIIPPDNCTGSFVLVKILNRWGNTLFESTDREFKWYGKNEPAGVYYYFLKFTNKEYKGSVSIQY